MRAVNSSECASTHEWQQTMTDLYNSSLLYSLAIHSLLAGQAA